MKNRKLGKYEILDRLGRGGMAEVYRAYHASLDRYVAIKVLHSFLSDEAEFKLRFEKEAQNIAKLRHPNIVQVYDFEFDEEGGSYYMVMELIEGPTLRDRLYVDNAERAHPLPVREAIRIMRQAADALSYAHSRGMIHRDVKPANLMLDTKENDRVVLTDFGIAKLLSGKQMTMSGGLVGTPAYMAPEQGMGETGDERSDLYALGVILYQMLTGELPYDADTPVMLLLSHMNDPIPSVRSVNPHLSPAADRVLEKMLAKEPDERYQTAEELVDALELLEHSPSKLDPATLILPAHGLSIHTDAETKTATLPPPANRNQRWWLWPLLLLIGIGGIGGGYLAAASAGLVPSLPFIAAAATETASPTATLTATASFTPSPSASPTLTHTPTTSASLTASASFTATPTATLTVTQPTPNTPTLTLTSTLTPSETPVAATPTPSVTANLTQTAAAQRTATIAACTFDYAIVEQVPDDGEKGGFFRAGEAYNRDITLLNTGSCAWEVNTSLTWISGESFDAGPRIFIRERVDPAEEVTILFEGSLPQRGSTTPFSGEWVLRTPGQISIGDTFTISILVFEPGSG